MPRIRTNRVRRLHGQLPTAWSTLKPPKVMSENASSVFLRHTAMTCGRTARHCSPGPRPKSHWKISLIRHRLPSPKRLRYGAALAASFFAAARWRVGFKRRQQALADSRDFVHARRNGSSFALDGFVNPLTCARTASLRRESPRRIQAERS